MEQPGGRKRPGGRPRKPEGERKDRRVQILVREVLLALWDEAVEASGDLNSRNQLVERAVNQYIEAELRRGWIPRGDRARRAAEELLGRGFDRSRY